MRKKLYRCILLDWDGCLAKTLDIWMDAYKKIFKEYGFTPTEREIVEKVFGDWEGPKKIGVEDNDSFTKKLVNLVNMRLPFVKLYPGVRATLRKLKDKNKKVAIITTSKRLSVIPAIKNLRLENFFDVILTAEDVVNHKPHPEILEKAMKILDGTENESLIVGDNEKDIQAGKAAGITTILYFPGENERFYKLKRLMDYRPDHLIRDFSRLLKII